jgi:hydrogenase expression/formation protein HypC
MCLAVPGKIISIDDSDPELKMARVKFGEAVRDICIQWVDDLKPGDYIMAHVGTALSKVDEEDAEFTLNALREMGEIEPGAEN